MPTRQELEARQLDQSLKVHQEWAQDTLDHLGISRDGDSVPSEQLSALSELEQEAVRAAAAVVHNAENIKKYIREGQSEAAVNAMYRLVMNWYVMPINAKIRCWWDGLPKGREQLRLNRDEKRKRCRRLAEETRIDSPSISAWSAAEHVSRKLVERYDIQLGQRQVHRYIKDLWGAD